MSRRPTIEELQAARSRLDGVARVTPVYASETISRLAGRPVLLKAENLQRTGSFKIRGAYNTVAQLDDDERRAGVVTASAGNHGQAVAWAAREAGIPATIVVPEGAPMAKVEAARTYGARVEPRGGGLRRVARHCPGARARVGCDVRARIRGSAGDRWAGDARARARRAAPRGPGNGRRAGRRRRPRVGRRDRARGPPARAARRRRAGGGVRTPRGAHADGSDHRRRDRRQAPGRAHGRDRRRARGRARRRRRRGDLPGARPPPRAREARRRGGRRGARLRRSSPAAYRARDRRARCWPAATWTRRRSTPSSATA